MVSKYDLFAISIERKEKFDHASELIRKIKRILLDTKRFGFSYIDISIDRKLTIRLHELVVSGRIWDLPKMNKSKVMLICEFLSYPKIQVLWKKPQKKKR